MPGSYNKFSQMVWSKINTLSTAPDGADYKKTLEHIKKADYYGVDVGPVSRIVSVNAINYIQERNEIYGIPSELPKDIQQDYEIIDAIKELRGINEEVNKSLDELLADLTAIQPRRPKEEAEGGVDVGLHIDNVKVYGDIIDMKKLKLGKMIAKNEDNSNYMVYISIGKYEGNDIAAKVYHKNENGRLDFEKINREIGICKRLSQKRDHSNGFLKYYGSCIDPDHGEIFIIMEYIERTLWREIEIQNEEIQSGIKKLEETGEKTVNKIAEIKDRARFSNDILLGIIIKLLKSFSDMESLGIFHRDIKPQNLLIDR